MDRYRVIQKSDPTQSVIEIYVRTLLKCIRRSSVAKRLLYIMSIFFAIFDYKVQLCNLRGHSMSVRKKVSK